MAEYVLDFDADADLIAWFADMVVAGEASDQASAAQASDRVGNANEEPVFVRDRPRLTGSSWRSRVFGAPPVE